MLSRILALVLAIGAVPAQAEAPASEAPSTPPANPPAAPQAATPQATTPPPEAPLAGWSDGTVFLRSPDNFFQLFPNGRLQTDGYVFARPTDKMPVDTFLVKRARIEVFGWISPWVGFNIAGDFAAGPTAAADPVAPSSQNATDDFILVAPWKDVAILQLGQFDAPFTLENRTSDKYFDFIERSHTVRAFGIPSNKEIGAMVHGLLPSKLVYYSVGAFNGDGQNFKNLDNAIDVMGRAWVAPFAGLKGSPVEFVTLGGSFWVGYRGTKGLPLTAQQTQGGFRYFGDKWTSPSKTSLELHQHGNLHALALELDAPIAHRYGLRFEYVNKFQQLGEDDVSQAASGTLTTMGQAALSGWSMYVQGWVWLLGDDTIVGRPGLQLPSRFEKFGTKEARHGVQLLARFERLDERITSNTPELADPNVGRTTVTSLQVGVTYWYTKRYRAMVNYVFNNFEGDSRAVSATTWGNLGGGHNEHEVLFRLGVAL